MVVPCIGLYVGRAGGKHRGMPSVMRRKKVERDRKVSPPGSRVELDGARGGDVSASQQFVWGNFLSPDTGLSG